MQCSAKLGAPVLNCHQHLSKPEAHFTLLCLDFAGIAFPQLTVLAGGLVRWGLDDAEVLVEHPLRTYRKTWKLVQESRLGLSSQPHPPKGKYNR